MRIAFREFFFDGDRRELLRDSTPVRLSPKAFQLLEILIENRPKAVSHEDLYDRLWPDTLVEQSNLHNVVYHLRAALGDAEQAIIRTVYGFGFSFAAPASDRETRKTSWQIVIGDREFDLREGENVVGRERDAAVCINDGSISRHHARIVVSPEGVSIEDLRSKNGTTLHGRRIHRASRLSSGDQILFGNVAAIVRAVDPTPSTQSVT